VSSPRPCVQCSKPIPVEFDSELCHACQIATSAPGFKVDTSNSFLALPSPTDFVSAGSGNSQKALTEHGTSSPGFHDSTFYAESIDPLGALADTASVALLPAPTDHLTRIERHPSLPTAPPGYDLIRRLGGGAMGDVYLAFEHNSEREVAIKFLRAPGNQAAVERFTAEVRALGRIDHENIVKIFATDFYCLVPFYTMEYLSGGTLAGLISPKDSEETKKIVRLMALVARAVNAAHEADVLHRDLKPSNILLSADGTPKVADFGLAKRTDRDDGLTLCSGPVGTASFMPPEQISRKYGELGPAADVYGLGATMYYVLTGRPPFTGESSYDIALKVTSEPAERVRSIRADIPIGLEAIVMKCLEKDPKSRYPTASALAEDLERFLAGEQQEAQQLTAPRRLRRWTVRNKRWLMSFAGALGIILGFLWLLIQKPTKQLDVRDVIRKEIADGKVVKLLTSDGLPRWADWPMGPAQLAGIPDDGGTCSFEMNGANVLLLLDNPGVDSFRISLEVCERMKRGLLFPTPMNTAYHDVGAVLSFGFQFGAVENTRVYSMHLVSYSEFDKDGKAPNKRVMDIQEFAVVEEHPLLARGLFSRQRWSVPITPVIPGPAWRKITVEVTPESIRVVEPKIDRAYLRDDIKYHRRELGQSVARSKAKLPVLPEWSPRMPIGIWCYDAEVAFRNVTIESLK
jgi:serine/threonine protein kinase